MSTSQFTREIGGTGRKGNETNLKQTKRAAHPRTVDAKTSLPAIRFAQERSAKCALNPAVRGFLVLPVYCPGQGPPPFWPGSIGTSLPTSEEVGYSVYSVLHSESITG